MPIPKYDQMYRELLDSLADGKTHTAGEMKEIIVASFSVSPEECRIMLPSKGQALLDNRIGWARTYLRKAGLIESPSRGTYRLTETGKQVIAAAPPVIDNEFLKRFDSFRQFTEASHVSGLGRREKPQTAQKEQGETPQDILDDAYQQMNDALASDLLEELMKQSPAFFERTVVRLLENMGYGGSLTDAGMVVGQSGDEGIDGIIREDKLGFSLIYIQAKRWEPEKSIGRPEVQRFVGALAGQGAGKGLFITTAQFTREAQEYAKKQHTTKVVLVDGQTLARLMIEYDMGVSTQAVYQLKRLDRDFFGEEN